MQAELCWNLLVSKLLLYGLYRTQMLELLQHWLCLYEKLAAAETQILLEVILHNGGEGKSD